LGERGGTRPMQGRAYDSLHGFQVDGSRLAAALENHLQKLFYFAGDLLVDRLRRFFSSGVSVSSTGRARQIRSFTASNSWLSCRKRWNVSTSRCALRNAAGEEKLSLMVFPFSLRVKRKFGPWPGWPG